MFSKPYISFVSIVYAVLISLTVEQTPRLHNSVPFAQLHHSHTQSPLHHCTIYTLSALCTIAPFTH